MAGTQFSKIPANLLVSYNLYDVLKPQIPFTTTHYVSMQSHYTSVQEGISISYFYLFIGFEYALRLFVIFMVKF